MNDPGSKLGSLVRMAGSSSNLIEVRDLVKRYKRADTNAVDGVSFGVRPGEFFSLLGPNGAGKTTTISILTTTLTPTSGHVTVDGLDAVKDAAGGRQKGVLFSQKQRLHHTPAGEETALSHPMLYGLPPTRPFSRPTPRQYRNQVADLAAVLGLEKEVFKPVKTLSGGMK